MGNCGFTIAPCKPADRDITMRNLTQVEDMALEVLKGGIDWGFETFVGYVPMLRSTGRVVNTAAYIGHSAVRSWVKGADDSKREATPIEIEQMQTVVRGAMAAGVVGFVQQYQPGAQRRRRFAHAVAPGKRC